MSPGPPGCADRDGDEGRPEGIASGGSYRLPREGDEDRGGDERGRDDAEGAFRSPIGAEEEGPGDHIGVSERAHKNGGCDFARVPPSQKNSHNTSSTYSVTSEMTVSRMRMFTLNTSPL